jgi:hypothetical protein
MSAFGSIFVSYARVDRGKVAELISKLRADGFDLWIDEEGIEGAAFWRKEIVDAIRMCSAVLFFASKASCQSENVSKELALASEERKPILPIFIEDVQLASEIRYQIAGLQHISLAGDPSRAHAQINSALMRLLRKQPESRLASPQERANCKRANFHPTWLAGGAVVFMIIGLAVWTLWSSFNKTEPSAKQKILQTSDTPIQQSIKRTTSPGIPDYLFGSWRGAARSLLVTYEVTLTFRGNEYTKEDLSSFGRCFYRLEILRQDNNSVSFLGHLKTDAENVSPLCDTIEEITLSKTDDLHLAYSTGLSVGTLRRQEK